MPDSHPQKTLYSSPKSVAAILHAAATRPVGEGGSKERRWSWVVKCSEKPAKGKKGWNWHWYLFTAKWDMFWL